MLFPIINVVHFKIWGYLEIGIDGRESVDNAVRLARTSPNDNLAINNTSQNTFGIHTEPGMRGQSSIAANHAEIIFIDIQIESMI